MDTPPSNIPLRPAWLEINSRAIENNARRLKEIIGAPTELMAMVKANAYGHGAVQSARAALRGGASWLGVVSVGEALELRAAGIDANIFISGATLAEWVPAAVENNLRLTVASRDAANTISQAARALAPRLRVHLKIDTGMTRLGTSPDEAVELIRELRRDGVLEIEGIFTHFAVADDPNARGIAGWGRAYTANQLALFQRVIDELERAGLGLRYYHASNSSASISLPAARLNLARSGILMYGLDPSPEVRAPEDFESALSFKTHLALVREVPRGTFIGYGSTFETMRASRIGVIMVGYADGFRRGPKNYGEVLVRGQRAPLVGRVSMDQSMIDVTNIPEAQPGAEVVLIGAQGDEKISAEEVAEKVGTNNYEVVTTISARVPRVYK